MKTTIIGARTRSLREHRNWSQEDLAKESGLKRPHISLIETGDRMPGAETLIKLADTFGVSVDFLLGRTDVPTVAPPPNHASFATREFRQLSENWAYLSDIGAKEYLAIVSGLIAHYKELAEAKLAERAEEG